MAERARTQRQAELAEAKVLGQGKLKVGVFLSVGRRTEPPSRSRSMQVTSNSREHPGSYLTAERKRKISERGRVGGYGDDMKTKTARERTTHRERSATQLPSCPPS